MFNTYQEQDKKRERRRLLLGGAALIGIGALALYGDKTRLANSIIKKANRGLDFAESKLQGGALDRARLRAQTSPTKLGRVVESFDKFVAFDLSHQAARSRATAHLQTLKGWETHAEGLFEGTFHSVDVLRSDYQDVGHVLQHPAYANRLPNLPKSQIIADVQAAHRVGNYRAGRVNVDDALLDHAQKLFGTHLNSLQQSRENLFNKASGIHKANWEQHTEVRSGFMAALKTDVPKVGEDPLRKFQDSVVANLKVDTWGKLSSTEQSLAKAAFHLKSAGAANPAAILNKIPTGLLSAGGETLDVARITDLYQAGKQFLGAHFRIPSGMGNKGWNPLGSTKFGKYRDNPFEVISAGMQQTDLSIGDTPFSFGAEGKVNRDIYAVGGRLFSTDENGNVVKGNGKKWQFLDDRHGFGQQWRERRTKQTRPSEDAGDVLRRLLLNNNPEDAISVTRTASNLAPDTQDLLKLYKSALAEKELPNGVPRNLKTLIENGLVPEEVAFGLRNIDAVAGRTENVEGALFTDADRFLGKSTRSYARRFAYDDIGTLAETVGSKSNSFGKTNPQTGWDRAGGVILDEMTAQLASADSSEQWRQLLMSKATTNEQKAYLWGHFRSSWIGERLETGNLRAGVVARELGSDNSLLKAVQQTLEGKSITDEGVSFYATPSAPMPLWQEIVQAGNLTIKKKDLSPLQALLDPKTLVAHMNETARGYGDAKRPGDIYGAASKLNDRLPWKLKLADSEADDTVSIVSNLIKYRALPAIAGIAAWRYGHYALHKLNLPGPVDLLANATANLSLNASSLGDATGVTPLLKKFSELTPGFDDYLHPRTREEQEEYLDRGFDPVRNGRFNLSSRNSFAGGTPSAFIPNWYRRATSHWQEADNVDLNSDDHWKHSFIPNPLHPLSTIAALMDPYWQEKKYARERPQMVSSPLFSEGNMIGDLGNATIGRIIKPIKMLHPEYEGGGDASGYGGVNASGSGSGGEAGGGVGSHVVSNTNKSLKQIYHQNLKRKKQSIGERAIMDTGDPILFGYQGLQDIQAIGNIQDEDTPKLIFNLVSPFGPIANRWRASKKTNPGLPAPHVIWQHRNGGYGEDLKRLNIPFVSKFFNPLLSRGDPDEVALNPLENSLPDWLPDEAPELRHGDAIQKLGAWGALRAPGAAFESARPHLDPRALTMRASSLGKEEDELLESWMGHDDPMSAYGRKATDAGTRLHTKIQEQWKRAGVLESAEGEIFNKKERISGHYDAILKTAKGRVVGEIKTVNQKRFDKVMREGPFEGHKRQLNFYLHELNIHKGMFFYVNRDNPDQVASFDLNYDPLRYHRDMGRVRSARNKALELMDSGAVHTGQFYDAVTKVETLADLAPNSDEYRAALAQAKDKELSPTDEQRLARAQEMAKARKSKFTIRDKDFTAPLESQHGFVQEILADGRLRVGGKVYRPAGVQPLNAGVAKDILEKLNIESRGGSSVEALYKTVGIGVGSYVKLRGGEDQRDVQVFSTFGGKELNKELINLGVEENKDDRSPAALNSRYGSIEKTWAKLWEHISHMDNPLGTKFGNRSALEHYEREQVHGTRSGSLGHPISTIIRPTLNALSAKNPISAGVMGAFIGGLFGRTMDGTKWGAIAGAAVGISLASTHSGSWIPGDVQRRRDLEGYWAALKWAKMTRLGAQEADIAKEKEHLDIEHLSKEKLNEVWYTNKYFHAKQALRYKRRAHQTRLGWNPEDGVKSALAAMPNYESELADDIIKRGSRKEKQRFYALLPDDEKRLLSEALGQGRVKDENPEEKAQEYFRNHNLPDADWEGWKQEIALRDMRAVAADKEGIPLADMFLSRKAVQTAKVQIDRTPVPTIWGHTDDLHNTLTNVIRGFGGDGLRIRIDTRPSSSHSQIDVKADFTQDPTDKYTAHIN